MKTTSLPSRMRGVSMVGWMLIAVVVIIFGSAGIKIIPAYMEYNTIKGTINNVLMDQKVALKSDREILDDIDRRFMINNVSSIRARDIGIAKQPNRVTLSVDYEVRENLFANIDLVMRFTEDFTKDARQ
jgi:hypothetical protein